MTDEEFTLMETNRERAIVKNSAFRRVTNKRPKSGNYGVEWKSEKELAKLNGPVVSYDPKKFYNWEEFKALPREWQEDYVKRLIDRYCVSYSTIAIEQFGVKRNRLSDWLIQHNPDYKCLRTRGQTSSAAGKKKYLDDLAAALCGADATVESGKDEEKAEQEVEIEQEAAVEPEAEKADSYETMAAVEADELAVPALAEEKVSGIPAMRRASFEMNGLDEGALDVIRKMFGGLPITVRIEVSVTVDA